MGKLKETSNILSFSVFRKLEIHIKIRKAITKGQKVKVRDSNPKIFLQRLFEKMGEVRKV